MGARPYAAAEWQSKALRFRRGPAKAQGRFGFLQSGAGQPRMPPCRQALARAVS